MGRMSFIPIQMRRRKYFFFFFSKKMSDLIIYSFEDSFDLLNSTEFRPERKTIFWITGLNFNEPDQLPAIQTYVAERNYNFLTVDYRELFVQLIHIKAFLTIIHQVIQI